jgi:peptide/nickel transport system permease protein
LRDFWVKKLLEFSVTIAVIVFSSYVVFYAIPNFQKEGSLPFLYYADAHSSFFDYVKEIASPFDVAFPNYTTGRQTNFFEYIQEPYMYSMTLIALSLLLTIVCATVLACIYVLSNETVKRMIERISVWMESVPDLLWIFALQLFLVWVFKKTGMEIVAIYTFGDTKAYFLPVLCMTLVPTLHFFRMIVLFAQREQTKPYIEFVYSQGFSKWYIVVFHLLRNTLYHLVHQLRALFVFMISTLFLVEFAFNIYGFTGFIWKPGFLTPPTLCLWLLLLYIPFFIVFSVMNYFIYRIVGREAYE